LARKRFERFVWHWNQAQGRSTPHLHEEIARWLEDRWIGGDRRLVLMVFRDAGKSTLTGLFCAWLLSRNPDLRILVLAAEHELACKMTHNVRGIIERHPDTRHIIPASPDQWAADRLTVRRSLEQRDPSLLARGIFANVTGARADVIVCDDVEVPNTADTRGKRSDLRERLLETRFVLVPDGTQLVIGTPHTYYSIYADEPRPEVGEQHPFLEGFTRLHVPLVDESGRSRWPERFDAAAVEDLRRSVGPVRFRSQMLLIPTQAKDIRLDPDRLRRYSDPLEAVDVGGQPRLRIADRQIVSASCWWDPSFGRPVAGDASVVAALLTDAEGEYWLQGIDYLSFDPRKVDEVDEATQLCRLVAAFVRKYRQPAVTIETNGIGRFLPSLLRRELRLAGVSATVLEQASTTRKERRILDALDPLLAARRLHAHESVWDTPFIEEMREWTPGGGARDDGLDAVSGCILSQPPRLRLPPWLPRAAEWRPGLGDARAALDFSP
jgi:hypothetical protein